MFIIPLTTDPAQRFTAVMEGSTVAFELRWLHLADVWAMDLSIDGVDLLHGQRLVMNLDMLEAHNFNIGGLLCYAAEEAGRRPGREELGIRVQLVHLTQAELDGAAIS